MVSVCALLCFALLCFVSSDPQDCLVCEARTEQEQSAQWRAGAGLQLNMRYSIARAKKPDTGHRLAGGGGLRPVGQTGETFTFCESPPRMGGGRGCGTRATGLVSSVRVCEYATRTLESRGRSLNNSDGDTRGSRECDSLAGYLLIAGVRADFSDKLCRTAKQTIGDLCLRIRENQEKDGGSRV